MTFHIRKFFWRLLGFDYQALLKKTDYTLLRNDKYTEIGFKTYDNGAKVWRWTNAPITIGKYCSIAHDVNFIVDEGTHTYSSISSFPLINSFYQDDIALKDRLLKNLDQKQGITIGNDVWIGTGAFIMPAVKVGNGVTIAANAVVTKDIPDYTVVAGVPAAVIRNKHNDVIVEKLNAIAWWDWHPDLVKESIGDFYKDVDHFVSKYYK